MEHERTANPFYIVYRDLEEQILSGRLKYGDKLPSLRGLSERYHVGVRTAKDALRVAGEGVHPYRGRGRRRGGPPADGAQRRRKFRSGAQDDHTGGIPHGGAFGTPAAGVLRLICGEEEQKRLARDMHGSVERTRNSAVRSALDASTLWRRGRGAS